MRRMSSKITSRISAAAKGGWDAAVRRGPVLWLTLCGALLVAGIFVVTTMVIGDFRERALVNNERELENTVLLLTRHFDQQFEDSETVAADLITQMNLPDISSPRCSASACRAMKPVACSRTRSAP